MVVLVICVSVVCLYIKTIVQPKSLYDLASNLINNEKYNEAADILYGLDHYKDSIKILSGISSDILYDANIDDFVYWGKCEQDDNISNGKEIIKWRVLDKNDGKLLILSENFVDIKCYSDQSNPTSAVTWSDSSLREWLNNDFYEMSFNEVERLSIIATTNINNDNLIYRTYGGPDTIDNIFLLSIDEVERYFPNRSDRIGNDSKYTKNIGANTSGYLSFWWLRSPGIERYYASLIDDEGNVGNGGLLVIDQSVAVRPAMWINVSTENANSD